jgi:hypothetical protein
MLGAYPLVAAMMLPPAAHSEGECKPSVAQPEQAVSWATQQLTAIWSRSGGGTPWFVMNNPICNWRCEPGRACPAHMLGLLAHVCYDAKYQLGLDQPDRAYHDDTHRRFGGKMMQVPRDLIQASILNPRTPDFKHALRESGYKLLEFSSTSVPNLPAGFARVLVLVETPDFDQWYQIAAYEGSPRTQARNVDMLVVEKRDETGREISPPKIYFNGYSRWPGPGGGWVQEGIGNPFGLNRCIMCHPSGLRGIHPREGSVSREEADTLKYIQAKLDETVLNDFAGYYDDTRAGPPMGPVDPPGRAALVAKCAAGMPEASRARIATAMSCASCHDGVNRGPLNAMSDYATIHHKVVGATGKAAMPPDEDLTAAERKAVSTCLRVEYKALLATWLGESRCLSTK